MSLISLLDGSLSGVVSTSLGDASGLSSGDAGGLSSASDARGLPVVDLNSPSLGEP